MLYIVSTVAQATGQRRQIQKPLAKQLGFSTLAYRAGVRQMQHLAALNFYTLSR